MTYKEEKDHSPILFLAIFYRLSLFFIISFPDLSFLHYHSIIATTTTNTNNSSNITKHTLHPYSIQFPTDNNDIDPSCTKCSSPILGKHGLSNAHFTVLVHLVSATANTVRVPLHLYSSS